MIAVFESNDDMKDRIRIIASIIWSRKIDDDFDFEYTIDNK